MINTIIYTSQQQLNQMRQNHIRHRKHLNNLNRLPGTGFLGGIKISQTNIQISGNSQFHTDMAKPDQLVSQSNYNCLKSSIKLYVNLNRHKHIKQSWTMTSKKKLLQQTVHVVTNPVFNL